MSVASKNPFDLLGNDIEEDGDAGAAPVKTVEKTSSHTAKRNTDGVAPATKSPVVQVGNRRGGGVGGNEAAFRDRNAGADRNRSKPIEEAGGRGAPRGGVSARGRGGRGGRHARTQDDRHTKGFHTGSEKQAAQSWGSPADGEGERKDEDAGEAIAKTELTEDAAEAAGAPAESAEATAEGAEGAEATEEEKLISYEEYQAEQQAKKAALEAELALNLRKPNEGVEDPKWENAVAIEKDDEEVYFEGDESKQKKQKAAKQKQKKQYVELENRFIETRSMQQDRPRGGRGGPRGGARGGDFGGRGDGGRGRGRGGARGREPRGDFAGRGDFTAGRGRASAPNTPNPSNEAEFPSLGS